MADEGIIFSAAMREPHDSAVEADRSAARYFFEIGYAAAYADGFMENGEKPAFTLSDAKIDRAWAIANAITRARQMGGR